MGKVETKDVIKALNVLNHETLAHKMFQGCFSEAVGSGRIRGLKKTSLFRSTLAYFLLVPGAWERFLKELSSVKLSR
jgi:hypothetical protein